MRPRIAVLAVIVIALSCGEKRPPPIATGPLPAGVVARVGSIEIAADLTQRVAQAQRVPPHTAVELLADDALAAQGARDRGIDRDPQVSHRVRALLARLVTDRLREEAKAKGPLTDAELEALTAEHWQELDAPEQRTAIHAVVLKPAPAEEGRRVAGTIRQAVVDETGASATSVADFETRANAVPHGSLTVRVESLPTFVADGRVSLPGAQGHFDHEFAAGAFAIARVGDTSPVVETSFGWHVIRLLEIIPARSIPIAQRRVLLGPEALARRARAGHDELLARLRARTPVEISLSAEESMKSVKPWPGPGAAGTGPGPGRTD